MKRKQEERNEKKDEATDEKFSVFSDSTVF